MVSSTPRPHFTSGKDPVPILQEAGWTPGPVWTGRKSRPHRDSIPDRPARSKSLYLLSYRAHLREVSTANILLGKPHETGTVDTNNCVLGYDVAYFSFHSGEISSSEKIKEFLV